MQYWPNELNNDQIKYYVVAIRTTRTMRAMGPTSTRRNAIFLPVALWPKNSHPLTYLMFGSVGTAHSLAPRFHCYALWRKRSRVRSDIGQAFGARRPRGNRSHSLIHCYAQAALIRRGRQSLQGWHVSHETPTMRAATLLTSRKTA